MPRANILRKRISTLATVAVLWAAPVASQQAALTVGQFQQLIVDALQAGNGPLAVETTRILLQRAPDNARALLWRTEAALLVQDYAGAVSYGRKAFWNARTNAQSFSAARLVALAHSRQQQDTRAQGWLRVARQYAPNDEARASVASDFRFLRNRNPLTVNLRFGITPTNNINGGTTNETILVPFGEQALEFTFSEDARPLSGWEISGSASATYRLHSNETSATFFDASFFGRTFVLTENSEERLEDVEDRDDGSDFASASLSFGLTHRFILTPGARPTAASLSFGRDFSAGTKVAETITVGASHSWKLNETDTFGLSALGRHSERFRENDDTGNLQLISPVRLYNVRGTWSTRTEDFGTFGVNVALIESISDDINEDYSGIRYGVNYAFPEPIFGVQIGTSVSYEERDYPALVFSTEDRQDTITTASVRATFTDVEFFGFRPVVTAQRSVRTSDNARFDTDSFDIGFDISSSF